MRIVIHPPEGSWATLLERPAADSREIAGTVGEILDTVRRNGDDALFDYSKRLDGVQLEDLSVRESEYKAAESALSPQLKLAMAVAKANIERFHAPEPESRQVIETTPGVFCWKRTLPIEKVGLYIPAGSAPLFSTVLMLAIPARIAGCSEIVMCTPPRKDGGVDPAILYAAMICGVDRVYKTGGAQAIAAMAYGTETVPKVYKVFGPGNQYVTEAKLQVLREGTAIDMPAGPSELAVLADESSDPAYAAADLLSQAEHGPDSQVVLVSTSRNVVEQILLEVERQLDFLPRKEIVQKALVNSTAVIVDSVGRGIRLLNSYAPEHLIIATADADRAAELVTNAGSVFIGNYSCESAGDYASGTNHTLPTNGAARAYSGLSVSAFTKTTTFQKLTAAGLRGLAPAIEEMAAAEGLAAHKNAVTIRVQKMEAAK